jgi:hypothetical protein
VIRRGPRLLALAAAASLLVAASPATVRAAAEADPLARLSGKRLGELRALYKKGRDTPRVVKALRTFLDDQDGGAKDRIDAGLETLHLASFLLLDPEALRPEHGLSREAVERHRARVLPGSRSVLKLAKELRFDKEGAGLARKSHEEKTAALWKLHFENNKKQILGAASIMKLQRGKASGRPLVVVLGAGSCADIPLKELVAGGQDVILVDLDEASLKKGIAIQVAPADRKHVQIEIRDLSEGAIEEITSEAARILRDHPSRGGAGKARTALTALFHRQRVSVPQLEGTHRADLIVSSLLMSQLPVFPSEEIGRRFAAQYKEPLVKSKDVALAQSAFGDKLFDAHMEALGDFVVRSRATVYFSSDLFLAPTYYDPSARKEVHGEPRPVVGYRGQPLLDLDRPFEKKPELRVVSTSASSGKPGSDFWVWNQDPAELSTTTETIKKRTAAGVVDVRVKKGFMRLIDSVTIVSR